MRTSHAPGIFRWSIALVTAIALAPSAPGQSPQPGGLQQPGGFGRDPNAAQEPGQKRVSTGEKLFLQTYEVGDLVVSVPDYAAASSGRDGATGVGGGATFGGGGGGFGGGGGAPGAAGMTIGGPAGLGSGSSDGSSAITMDSLIEALTACVAQDSWAVNGGGQAQVRVVGTSLVVAQTKDGHALIADFLTQLRNGSATRKTVAIDARWLFLTSDDLDQLLGSAPDSDGARPALNRELLAKFTRRPTSLRAITNCFSGQRVYLISGTRRNVVSGYIPVVGSLDRADEPALVNRDRVPKIVFAQLGPGNGGGTFRDSKVGYQPIVEKPNFGAVLEIRPTVMQGEPSAVVDLKSTLTFPSDEAADATKSVPLSARDAQASALAPQVDRLAVQAMELATTLRVTLGQPVLAGGMTYLAPAEVVPGAATPDDSEKHQLYLVLEVR